MLDIEPLNLEHISRFSSESDVSHELQFALDNLNIRMAFSVLDQVGTVIGVLGASYIGVGIWEGWFYPSIHVHKHPRALVKTSQEFSRLIVEKDMHRLQIAVLDSHRKWAESIGFQFEGIVKKYHGNKDHFMYIKVRG